MTVTTKKPPSESLEAARRALRSLTPAEAEILRRRFGPLFDLDESSATTEDEEALRQMTRDLAALKKRGKK
jgi:hypothetical protein